MGERKGKGKEGKEEEGERDIEGKGRDDLPTYIAMLAALVTVILV